MQGSLDILKVFVATGCAGCRRAVELAAWVRQVMPQLIVQVIDVTEEWDSDSSRVFAVPVFMYSGRTVFWGNPSRRELRAWLTHLAPEA